MSDKKEEIEEIEQVENDAACEEEQVEQDETLETAQDNKVAEVTNLYQRTLAEFDNFRKRTSKEMAVRYDDGVRAACEELLPLVDNFERALNAHDNKDDSFYQGVAMIARQLDGILSSLGVQEIELVPGAQFDPSFHNAVAHAQDDNFGQNEVTDILQKGYIHNGKVLRYSMVRVAN